MDVTVVVATFGGREWEDLANSRAIPSAEALGVRVVHSHAGSLHEARNYGLAQVDTEYVCHLDADDELEDGYFHAMAYGTADLRAPSVQYEDISKAWAPRVPKVAGHDHDCTGECLPFGNFLVVGALARTQLLRDIGGWRDWPLYEDWDLWLRAWRAGATVETVPEAVYRAYVRHGSRNRTPDRELKESTHRAIVESVDLEYGALA